MSKTAIWRKCKKHTDELPAQLKRSALPVKPKGKCWDCEQEKNISAT